MSEEFYGKLCQRPGLGKAGRASQLTTNYFPLKLKAGGTVHHYDITITPDVPSLVNKEIFQIFQDQYAKDTKVLGNVLSVFDGVKNAFSPRLLPFGPMFETEITLPERGGKPNPKSPRVFKLSIKKVNEIPIDIPSMHERTPDGLVQIMAYNILFRHQPTSNFLQVRDSFYTRDEVRTISGGVEVWGGYFRSFMPGQDGLALNVDTTVCTFYKPGNLLDLIVSFIGLRSREDLLDPRFKSTHKRVKSFLKNLRVNLSYRGESAREYKVFGMSEVAANALKFDLEEDGKKKTMTVAQYFTQKFGIRLQFPTLPCVELKRGVMVPMELCEVLPGQRYSKKLDEGQTAEMIKITCVQPKARAEKIMKGFKLMQFEKNEYLRQFGVEVLPNLKQVDSRILPTPTVLYHPTSREKTLRPVDGAWNLRDKKLFEGKVLNVWAVIVFGNENRIRRNVVEAFIKEHVITCGATGMRISNPQPDIHYAPPRPDIVDKVLKDVFTATGNKFNARPQMILCVLPDKGAELYGSIKTAGELGIGIPTQCVQADKVFRPNKQYCANVCLKMNAKLGGINASMQPADLCDLKAPPTLILGADVTHPSPGNIEANSIAAVIGSVDFTCARYSSSVKIQESRVEIIIELQKMVVELLKAFYRTSKSKPAHIIYFRDGVSEGQFQQVLCHEMKAIKLACATLEKGYNPKVTFVVVQKRHHTRFFPTRPDDMDKSGNCKAGTVVESNICHPHFFDFFLQSHSGLQGTSRPVHYHVLVDEIRFSTDKLQKLCYNLCYLFSRATRAVSLVPPVYYAHLAATRARCHYKISELSDTASVMSAGKSDLAPSERRPVRPELINVMYYV